MGQRAALNSMFSWVLIQVVVESRLPGNLRPSMPMFSSVSSTAMTQGLLGQLSYLVGSR